MRRRLPVIAGRMAKDFFQNSFRISAFVNGGVHHWQTTGRQLAGGKTAASRYGPLDAIFTLKAPTYKKYARFYAWIKMHKIAHNLCMGVCGFSF